VLAGIGLALLVAWLAARVFSDLGSAVHVLLLAGLFLLLLSIARRRDAAERGR